MDNKIKGFRMPPDLKSFTQKKIAKRVVPCLLLELLFGLIIVLWGDILFATDVLEFKYSCYFVIMIIPFVVTGVPFKLIDRTYAGVIESAEVSTIMTSTRGTRRHKLIWKNKLDITIRTTDGKLLIKTPLVIDINLSPQRLEVYKQGDRVFHLYGTDTIVKLPTATDTHVACAVCGHMNSLERNSCSVCDHTLIKNQIKIFQETNRTGF